jgi:hypothetical protein
VVAAVEAEPGVPGVACVTGTSVSRGAAAAVGIGPGPTNVAAGNTTSAAPTYAAAVAAQALTMDSMPLPSGVTVPDNKHSSPATANGADSGGGGKRTSRQSGLAKAHKE